MRKLQFLLFAIAIIGCGSGSRAEKVKSINDSLAQDLLENENLLSSNLSDTTKLINYTLFNEITIGIPDLALASEKNEDKKVKKLGFAFFESKDEKVDITVRKMDYLPIEEVRSMMDMMSVGMYKGEIKRSEIIQINGIKIFVTDISGHWNGQDERIGMFRYYFNKGNDSYNLLMKYPDSVIKMTKKLKENMLKSIVLE
ncbi:hypothetical protein [Labilibacter marinus]|uniref:hypothetical protein n=1 Tax=Labilibacter marinus TaxID=1477105 RepID=UPI00094FE5C3|nr:hypothetical protein [Labilibacter marinus]